MDEQQLREIEGRASRLPAEQRQDVTALLLEVRRLKTPTQAEPQLSPRMIINIVKEREQRKTNIRRNLKRALGEIDHL
jgi:hypothetical protein